MGRVHVGGVRYEVERVCCDGAGETFRVARNGRTVATFDVLWTADGIGERKVIYGAAPSRDPVGDIARAAAALGIVDLTPRR